MIPGDDIADRVVAEALGWVGTPYRHQGRRKGVGVDCVGLVIGVWQSLYGAAPAAPPTYSADWAEASGEERLLEAARRHLRERAVREMRPGDVLLFRWRQNLPAKHAGILVGPARFVHAYAGHAVTVSALLPQWRSRFAGAFAFPSAPEPR